MKYPKEWKDYVKKEEEKVSKWQEQHRTKEDKEEFEGEGRWRKSKQVSKEWIHREQTGKVRGVQRLGFKPVIKRRSIWQN